MLLSEGFGTELGDERRPGGAPRELEFDRWLARCSAHLVSTRRG